MSEIKNRSIQRRLGTWLSHQPVNMISNRSIQLQIIESIHNKKKYKLVFDEEALYIYKISDEKEGESLKFNYDPESAFFHDVHNYLRLEIMSD